MKSMVTLVILGLISASAFAKTAAIVNDGIDSDLFLSGTNAEKVFRAAEQFAGKAKSDGALRTVVISKLACEGDIDFNHGNCITGISAYQGIGDGGTKESYLKSERLIGALSEVLSEYKKDTDKLGFTLADFLLDKGMGRSMVNVDKIACQKDVRYWHSTVCKLQAEFMRDTDDIK